MTRPTRTLRWREPAGGCKFASVKERRSFGAGVALLCWPRLPTPPRRLAVFLAIFLLHPFHAVPDLVNHAAYRPGILWFHHLRQSRPAEAADVLTHVICAA